MRRHWFRPDAHHTVSILNEGLHFSPLLKQPRLILGIVPPETLPNSPALNRLGVRVFAELLLRIPASVLLCDERFQSDESTSSKSAARFGLIERQDCHIVLVPHHLFEHVRIAGVRAVVEKTLLHRGSTGRQ